MMSVTCFRYRFTPNWVMLLLSLLFISLFIRLGVWQLARAKEKNQLIHAEQALSKRPPISWPNDHNNPPQPFQRFAIEGRFLSPTLLLDNQFYHHQVGYDIVSPFLLSTGTVVLVDRGWVARDNTAQPYPTPQTPASFVHLMGSVYFPSTKSWVLGNEIEKKEADFMVIERINTDLIRQLLHKSVHPFIIRLDKASKHGFVRDWQVVNFPPARHQAYALQWFLLAFVICILSICLNFKKIS